MPGKDESPVPAVVEAIDPESVFRALPDPVFLLDPGLHLVRWNDQGQRSTGLATSELAGTPFLDRLHPEDREPFRRVAERAAADATVAVEARMRDNAGEYLPYRFTLSPVRDDAGSLRALAAIARDSSDQHRLERRLQELSTLDPLTGVANRREIESRLRAELLRVQRYGGTLSVLLFDLDRFKEVNDTAGHEAGDEVIRRLARMVQQAIRASDHLGRWSGGEFLVVASEMDLGEATGFAVKLRHAIEDAEFGPAGGLTASFGVAGYRTGEPLEALVRRADDALFLAKKRGRNRVETERS